MNDIAQEITGILKHLIDPEVGMDVITLGLLESATETEQGIRVEMVPTTPGCPMLHTLEQGARALLEPKFPGTEIEIVWRLDVEWSPDRITRA